MPHGPVISLEVFQNQRWWPISKWKPGKLLPSDRAEYSSRDGKERRSLYGETANSMLPEGFIWTPNSTWSLEVDSATTDSEGWQYAFDFPSSYQKKMTMGCMVRRRRWWREAVFVGKEESVAKLVVEPPPPASSPKEAESPRYVYEDGRTTPPEDRPENYPVSSGEFQQETTNNNSEEEARPQSSNVCAVAAEKGERFSLPHSFSAGSAVVKEPTPVRGASFVLGRAPGQEYDAFGVASRQQSSDVFIVPAHAYTTVPDIAEPGSNNGSFNSKHSVPSPMRTLLVDDSSPYQPARGGKQGGEESPSWNTLPPEGAAANEAAQFEDLLNHFASSKDGDDD